MGIQKSMQKTAKRLDQKSLEIPEGNLVFLYDHLESCNKIQDKYKSEEFVVVGRCPEPNVYLLSKSMAMALSRQSIDANSKILGESRMTEYLPVLRIIMMGHKFPLLTQN